MVMPLDTNGDGDGTYTTTILSLNMEYTKQHPDHYTPLPIFTGYQSNQSILKTMRTKKPLVHYFRV